MIFTPRSIKVSLINFHYQKTSKYESNCLFMFIKELLLLLLEYMKCTDLSHTYQNWVMCTYQCHMLQLFTSKRLYVACLQCKHCFPNYVSKYYLLDRVWISSGRIFNFASFHTVWETESRVTLFYFLFKLLQAVKECNHCCIKFCIPQKPETTWAIQWQFTVFSQHLVTEVNS